MHQWDSVPTSEKQDQCPSTVLPPTWCCISPSLCHLRHDNRWSTEGISFYRSFNLVRSNFPHSSRRLQGRDPGGTLLPRSPSLPLDLLPLDTQNFLRPRDDPRTGFSPSTSYGLSPHGHPSFPLRALKLYPSPDLDTSRPFHPSFSPLDPWNSNVLTTEPQIGPRSTLEISTLSLILIPKIGKRLPCPGQPTRLTEIEH